MAQNRQSENERAREMEALYREYRSPMLRIAMSMLHDQGLGEDAVQQAFLKIFQNFEKIQLQDCNKTKSFIVILIKNTAIDLYRKRGRERIVSFEDLSRPLQAEEALPEEAAIAGLEAAAVAACLAKMDAQQASLLVLRYYHGYRNKEIAEMLGMPQAQVALKLYRAKEKLRRCLEGGENHGGKD